MPRWGHGPEARFQGRELPHGARFQGGGGPSPGPSPVLPTPSVPGELAAIPLCHRSRGRQAPGGGSERARAASRQRGFARAIVNAALVPLISCQPFLEHLNGKRRRTPKRERGKKKINNAKTHKNTSRGGAPVWFQPSQRAKYLKALGCAAREPRVGWRRCAALADIASRGPVPVVG